VENRKKLKSKKNGYVQKYWRTVRRIRGVSPEEEKRGYGEGFSEKEGFKLKPGMKE